MPWTFFVRKEASHSSGVEATTFSVGLPKNGFVTSTNFTYSQNWLVELAGKNCGVWRPASIAFP
jgi:hypothetical protein